MATPTRIRFQHLLLALPALGLLTGAEGKCGAPAAEPAPEPSFTYCGEGGWVFLAPGDCAPVRDCSAGLEAPAILEHDKSLTLTEPAPDWLDLDLQGDGNGPRTQVFCAAGWAPPGEEIDVNVEVADILSTAPDGTLDLAFPSVLKTKVFVINGPLVSISPPAKDFFVGEPIVLLASLVWQDSGTHDPIPLKWSVTDEVGEPFSYTLSGGAIQDVLLPGLTTTDFRLAMETPLPAGRYLITAEATFPGTGVKRSASASIRVLHSNSPRLELGNPTAIPGDPVAGCTTTGLVLRLQAPNQLAPTDARTSASRALRRTSTGWEPLLVEIQTAALDVKGVCEGDELRVLEVIDFSSDTDWDWWHGIVPAPL